MMLVAWAAAAGYPTLEPLNLSELLLDGCSMIWGGA